MHSWTWLIVAAVVLAALIVLAVVALGTFKTLPALQAAQIKLQGRQVDMVELSARLETDVLDPVELLQLRLERTSEQVGMLKDQVAMLKANLPAKSNKKA